MAIETDPPTGESRELGRVAIGALVLLFGGALLFFFRPIGVASAPMMLLGLALAGLAREWRPREKVIAAVLLVALLAAPFVASATFARDWGFAVLVFALLWPVAGIVGGAYLIAMLVRRKERARAEPGQLAIE